MNRNELRSKLFTAGAVPKKTVPLKLENGETLEIEVHGLSQVARGKIMDECMRFDDEGNQLGISIEKMTPVLLVETLYIDGEKLFTDGDLESVGALGATFLDPVFKVAMELSGLGKAELKNAEGNSDGTTVSTSDSILPTS